MLEKRSALTAGLLAAFALVVFSLISLAPSFAFAEEQSGVPTVQGSEAVLDAGISSDQAKAEGWKFEKMPFDGTPEYIQILDYRGSNAVPVVPGAIDGLPVTNVYIYAPCEGVDVSGCPALQNLNCVYLGLDSLDVAANAELEVLNCSRNNLTELDLSGNPKLRELDCDNNQLTSLSIANNPLLTRLVCNDNAIADLSDLQVWSSKEGATAQLEPQNVASHVPDPQLYEFNGYDRYDVSRLLVSAALDNDVSKGAIIVSGEDGKFADALAANALSGLLDYPVVLTTGSHLNSEAYECLKWLRNSNSQMLDLIVVGGPDTVQQNVLNELSNYGWVTRISGADRYALAKRVYAYGAAHGGWNEDKVIVAKGNDFPDALSIAPYASARATPILLVDSNSDSLDAETRELLSNHKQTVVLGGTDSVSARLYEDIEYFSQSSIRLGGKDRFEASLSIAQWELGQGMSFDGLGFATGWKFTDALASGFYLSQTDSILLLVDSVTPSANAALCGFLSEHAGEASSANIFGGTASVAPKVRNELVGALGW